MRQIRSGCITPRNKIQPPLVQTNANTARMRHGVKVEAYRKLDKTLLQRRRRNHDKREEHLQNMQEQKNPGQMKGQGVFVVARVAKAMASCLAVLGC